MSTKTLAVLDESELNDGQMSSKTKEVSFDDGKVLLSRIGNKIHATSAFCTHYGAPLAKGVLAADGRVTCPWHGACFNVCTGDIEDAPAPTAIHSFDTSVSEGKIYVTANPQYTLKDNKSRPPKLSTKGYDANGRGTVIIGGGSATFQAVDSLREHGYKHAITILSREPHGPIDRPKLSKALITDPTKLEWKTPSELKIKYGVTLRLASNVTSVDLTKKEVYLNDGKDSLQYDQLILATGGVPRRLPIPGADLEGIYTLRGIRDTKDIDAVAEEGKNMVVIGSSFIGMELVTALSKRKLQSIHVIGMEEYPFENVLGKEVGAALKKYHESQGVIFHMKTKIEKIVPRTDKPSAAGGVIVDGETVPADFIIMGVGVAPETSYLKDSGITLEKDGSVKVDEYLRVVNVPSGVEGVYAAGDIATYPDRSTQAYRRVEHWSLAGNHGRAVGATIAGAGKPFDAIPVFWSAQGQQLRYAGHGLGFDDVIVKGNLDELKFIAYYVRQGVVVAVASMQNDPVVSKCAELLRLGLMPSPDELKNGKDVLTIDISTEASLASRS